MVLKLMRYYKDVCKQIQSGEHDQEALDVSGQILVANPDVYTLWNLRKKVFQEWQKTM